MAQFPYLPLFTDAWKADTDHLTGPIGRQKRCLYLDLLVVMWRSPGCRVPNDDAWLMPHLHVTEEELRNLLRPVIAEFCHASAGDLADGVEHAGFEVDQGADDIESENLEIAERHGRFFSGAGTRLVVDVHSGAFGTMIGSSGWRVTVRGPPTDGMWR